MGVSELIPRRDCVAHDPVQHGQLQVLVPDPACGKSKFMQRKTRGFMFGWIVSSSCEPPDALCT